MTTDEMLLNSNRFVMLDLADTIWENHKTRDYPIVQVVDQSNKYFFQNVEAIKAHIENKINFEEKREDLFIITLNIDEDYRNQVFR